MSPKVVWTSTSCLVRHIWRNVWNKNVVSDYLFWGPKRLGMKVKKMFSLDLHVYHNFHRALGLSTSPYLKKLSQKMQEGVIKNSENPIKVALIYIVICQYVTQKVYPLLFKPPNDPGNPKAAWSFAIDHCSDCREKGGGTARAKS